MLYSTIVVSVVSLLYWLIQSFWALAYVTVLRRAQCASPPDAKLPKFCVGMFLRGADPDLDKSIQSILDQDYPRFELHITVDSVDDPAWEIVDKVIKSASAENVRVAPLKQRLETCSRYCSNHVQFFEGLDDSCELVAFAAGDLIAPKDWLRNMAIALSDPNIGATLGNRWYVPSVGWWGSLVRHLWNVGAVVPMWIHQIPWAGGLAMRLRDVKRSGFVEKLKHAMIEDSHVKPSVQMLGLKMKFVPQLIISNREEIGLTNCCQFLGRQLLWTKLYHPHWIWVVLQALCGTAVMFGSAVLAIVAFVAGEPAFGLWNCGVFLAYLAGMLALTELLEFGIRKILRSRGEDLPTVTPTTLLRLFVTIPLTQLIHN